MANPDRSEPGADGCGRPVFGDYLGIKKFDGGPVFGQPLASVVNRGQHGAIPAPVAECLHWLRLAGLEVEGIFRIPGAVETYESLRCFYDGTGAMPEFKQWDPHNVAGLLKLYLRMLPEPLLTYQYYQTLIFIQRNPDRAYRLKHMRNVLNALPEPNRLLLIEIGKLLIEVAEHSAKNKMNIPNLAIVFGPELMRPPNDSMLLMIKDAGMMNGIVKFILEEFDFLLLGAVEPKDAGPAAAVVATPTPTATTTPQPTAAPAPSITTPGRPVDASSPAGDGGAADDGEPLRRGGARWANRRRERIKDIEYDPAELHAMLAMEETQGGGHGGAAQQLMEAADDSLGGAQHQAAPEPIEVSSHSEVPAVVDWQHRLSNPVEYINERIAHSRALTGRPAKVRDMTPEQVQSEKNQIKAELKLFDVCFKHLYGHLPGRDDKEVLRPLYYRYNLLRKLLSKVPDDDNKLQKTASMSAAQCLRLYPPPDARLSANSAHVLEMAIRQEKRELQTKLLHFEHEFEQQHGRKVMSAEDAGAMAVEYTRYNSLKAMLAEIQDSLAKSLLESQAASVAAAAATATAPTAVVASDSAAPTPAPAPAAADAERASHDGDQQDKHVRVAGKTGKKKTTTEIKWWNDEPARRGGDSETDSSYDETDDDDVNDDDIAGLGAAADAAAALPRLIAASAPAVVRHPQPSSSSSSSSSSAAATTPAVAAASSSEATTSAGGQPSSSVSASASASVDSQEQHSLTVSKSSDAFGQKSKHKRPKRVKSHRPIGRLGKKSLKEDHRVKSTTDVQRSKQAAGPRATVNLSDAEKRAKIEEALAKWSS